MNLGGTIRLNRVGVLLIIGVCVIVLLYMNARSAGIDDKQAALEKSLSAVSLKNLLIAAIEIAERGGKEVVAVRREPSLHEKSKGKTKEGVNEPVTKADFKSHCAMYFSLKHSFPHIKVISEEKAAEKDCSTLPILDLDPSILHVGLSDVKDEHISAEDISVWIDPLDATKEYTENLLQYVTTMVCVAVKGQPIIGVIHRPFDAKSATSWAWVGKAVSEDLQHLKKIEEDKLKVIVSRSHAGKAENISKQAFGTDVDVVSAGGSGYKCLEVVSGNVSAYIHTTAIKKWDVCAGNAILVATGGKMTTLANEDIDYSTGDNEVNENGILGTMSKHDWFIEKLSKVKVFK